MTGRHGQADLAANSTGSKAVGPAAVVGGEPDADRLAELLRKAASGDEDSWRSIVQLYARRVYALARSRLCSSAGTGDGARVGRVRGVSDGLWVRGQDVAEEVTQSVFVTIAAKLSTGEYTEQGRFESWLFRVAMNRIRDEARRTKRQAQPTDPETFDSVVGSTSTARESDDRADAEDQVASLRRALGELSESDREIVELRHHAGLSFKQMSELLSEPLGTLLARHHRALRKLKEIMTGAADAPANASGDAL